MSQPSLRRHPSLDTSAGEITHTRPSLFDAKDEFIDRIGPVAVAAIYFGSFSLAPRDASLSRQALFKLSFVHRHFLHPAGLRIAVEKQTAILTGTLTSPVILTMGEILAHQIEGIRQVEDKTESSPTEKESIRVALQLLFATDQTLRSGVHVASEEGRLVLQGEVRSETQKNWADQLAAAAVGSEVDSHLRVSTFTPPPLTPAAEPPQVDDESLQALVLIRLRLIRDTELLPVKVKASRGVLTLQGKVQTEAQRQRVENVVRSTLGVRELRSSLSIAS